MEWTEGIDLLLHKWRVECDEIGNKHNKAHVKKKRLHRIISIPTILVPVIMASIGQLYNICHDYEAQVANSMTYLVTGTFGGLATFLNYGRAYEAHSQSEVRYHELRNEIDTILIKPMESRGSPTLAIEYVRSRLELLNKTSPDV
jgi:hypothetical protein